MGGGGAVGGQGYTFKNELEGEIGLVMGHWWLKTLWNDGKSMPQVFIQHHETWQVHTAHYWLLIAPWRPQAASTDHQTAKKKTQPAKADQLLQANFDTKV